MRTPLYEEHLKLGAKFIDFHGWEMPLQYSSIIEEHKQVRNSVGLFDVSHMGDILIEGKDAAKFMSYMLPSDIQEANPGKAIYSAYLNKNGMMIDDTIAYKISEEKIFVIPNAATTEKIFKWLLENSKGFNVRVINYSSELCTLALQGPESASIMNEIYPKATELEHFTFMDASDMFGERGLDSVTFIARTGYTGEDGFEFIIPNGVAISLWRKIVGDKKVMPIGLGARDTLRMEKGFLLSGQDFNEDRTPIEAGISWIINWDHDFIGKEALLSIKDNSKQRFRGLISLDKTIPRSGSKLFVNGENIGILTSGGYSPSLAKGIGLGYVNSDVKLETQVEFQVREAFGKGLIKKPRLV